MASNHVTVRRLPARGKYDWATTREILDEAMICHVGFMQSGRPFVIPMGYAREGKGLMLHGASNSRVMRMLASGIPACVTVTLLDGLVLAHSYFHHSMNYRSVVMFGSAREVTDPKAKRQALTRFVGRMIPGREMDARPPDARELRATSVAFFEIEEFSAKVRSGPPGEYRKDSDGSTWTGVVPFAFRPGSPSPDSHGAAPIPAYLEEFVHSKDMTTTPSGP